MVKKLIGKIIRAGKASAKQAAKNSAKSAKEQPKRKVGSGKYGPPQKLSSTKKKSTPTQRAFGGGQRRGLSKGRKQGAIATAAVGLSVSAILAITSKRKLDELKQQNLDANQRAAVNKALRQVAEKKAAKAKMGGTKPKPRPKK
tara:strand:- start:43 stop:474 length:432 start_codon:yes stop_codon:yes gene_type:complete